MSFGEKQMEYSAKHGTEIPVWQSPKYIESRAKAVEIISGGKYGVQESDFWILMNATKTNKMAYTGLIISHNGCLKINDCLESKFNPACVSLDKEGYKGSLVYSYCNPEQGIYEVGEVNGTNCKNEYPYAMAYKRLFDRVVLKLSKLAYAGIYSDSEADEFARRLDDGAPQSNSTKADTTGDFVPQCADCKATITPAEHDYSAKKYKRPLCRKCQGKVEEAAKMQFRCQHCGGVLKPYIGADGKEVSVRKHAEGSKERFNGAVFCIDCIRGAASAGQAAQAGEGA